MGILTTVRETVSPRFGHLHRSTFDPARGIVQPGLQAMGEFKAVFSWIGTLLARSAGAG